MADPCKIGYHHSILPSEALILEFERHPCCNKNCVGAICGLPAPSSGGYCGTCYTDDECTRLLCCLVQSRQKSFLTSNQKKAEFMELVTANRAGWDLFRLNDKDSKEASKEKKAKCAQALMLHFQSRKRIHNGSYDWDECYNIVLNDGESVKVCKLAWCAIVGVTKGGVEYTQKRIRSGHVPIEDIFNEKVNHLFFSV